MRSFKKYFDYYEKLYGIIPEDYSVLGKFGEGCWGDLISEGLITSYPKDKVVKFLQSYRYNGFEIRVVNYPNDANIDLYVDPGTQKIEDFVEIINKSLNVFGYFVGKIGSLNHFNEYNLLIEPRYPVLLSDDEMLDSPFYHVTYEFLVPKIRKVGLVPRESTTIFSHPGNRIYLIQTNNRYILSRLRTELGSSKIKKAKKEGIVNPDRFSPKNMVILKVNAQGKLYKDPMFGDSKDYNAVFTTNNIHPSNIELTDF